MTSVIDRRTFLAGTGAVLLAAPLAAEGQARVYRVGFLAQGSPPSPGTRRFFWTALRELGYVEGQNLILEYRYAEGRNERFPGLAVDLVALKPEVIVADSTPAAIAAKRATTVIPIVFVNVSDPVGTGIAASLARPGGNVTGGTDFGTALAVKQVDLVKDLLPGKAFPIAVLMSDNPVHALQLKLIQDAAKSIPLTILPTMVKTEADFEEAFASMVRQKATAFIWLGGAPVSTPAQRDKIVALSASSKLPALYPSRGFVDHGGLLSYGPTYKDQFGTAAIYVDKILKGAKPADLPVEQPTKFELVINLKTAKALGLTIPPLVLGRADQVIE
jgi:putative tryptophan/tyrosine transport system substrate-binding protein